MDEDEITKQYMNKLQKFTTQNKDLDMELDALMNNDPELQMFGKKGGDNIEDLLGDSKDDKDSSKQYL
jgi:hypothetical protein